MQLSHTITFYVPSTRLDKAISSGRVKARVNQIAEVMTSYYGGATLEACQGWYKAKSGQVINEDIVKVTAFATPEAYKQHKQDMLKLAQDKRAAWDQESILVQLDNNAHLVGY